MKKKGLIISTVVMVVVLIASLTTATYAWFTASTVTSLNGFDVSVISANAVNIGVKTDYTHYLKDGTMNTTPVSSDAFRTGTVKFSGATAGTIKSGTWSEGSSGLSATLDPQIHWGAQNTAVGFTSSTLNDGDNVLAMNTVHDWNGSGNAFKGNKDSDTTVKGSKAQPNNSGDSGDGNGDYVHFILGVSPTKDLGLNNFVVVVEPTGSSDTLGVLASLHVAYRMTKYNSNQTTDWNDVDLYGKYTSGTRKAAVTANASTTGENAIEGGEVFTNNKQLSAAYSATYGTGVSAPQGSIAYQITGLDTDKDAITQLEVVIYMSGTDSDCNDQGKTSAGSIKMFFNTQERSSALTKAEYTLTEDSKTMTVTLTGVSTTTGTEVYYQIGNAEAVKATLTGNTFTITSDTAITPSDVKVYQTEPNKAASKPIGVTLKS